MNAFHIPIDRTILVRFVEMMRALLKSEVGGKAKALFIVLILFLFGINALNVLNSYVGRDFMTAIEHKNMSGFLRYALLYVGVFAATTVTAVLYRYAEERLGLIWRKWLTDRAVTRYLDNNTYFRLHDAGDLPNPDQRIAEDIRSLTSTTLSFVLLFLNASFTVVAFSGVMWTISPLLFAVAIAYAALGSFFTIYLGKPLVRLNYDQLDKEANFRARLLHVGENAASIALLRREGRLKDRLLDRLDQLTSNYQRIIEVNRNLGYFTTGYNYLIQIIPALVVAPLFIDGKADFGVISQSAMAFGHLLGAFSLIVTQFQSISNYTAVIARLGGLRQAMDNARPPVVPEIESCDSCGIVDFQGLTLRSRRRGRILVDNLNLRIPMGTCVLIRTQSDSTKHVLFRASADLWDKGDGTILRPGLDDMMFVPERPYLPPGTLREALLHTGKEEQVTDEQMLEILHSLKLESVLRRIGGLDNERKWSDLLSLSEQQLLAFARVLIAAPSFVFLDQPSRALSDAQVHALLRRLRDRGITYLTLGDDDDITYYDQLLEIAEDGSWTLSPLPTAAEKADVAPAPGVTPSPD
jgi:vitamin B12/bleomycin/antimicrobial peptide transport system ATP-binding/permease protein